MEEKAARAYDLAALKYWGPSTHINFPVWFFKNNELLTSKLLIFQKSKPHCVQIVVLYFWQLENYQTELEEMKNMSRQEYVAHLRR